MEIILIGLIASAVASVLDNVATQKETGEELRELRVPEAVNKLRTHKGILNISRGASYSKVVTTGKPMASLFGPTVYLTAEEHTYLQSLKVWDSEKALSTIAFIKIAQRFRAKS